MFLSLSRPTFEYGHFTKNYENKITQENINNLNIFDDDYLLINLFTKDLVKKYFEHH